MSTYSLTVTGPNARLAMIKGWLTGLATHTRSWWHTATRSLTRTNTTLKATANVALAAIGSSTGYALTLGLAQAAVRAAWHGVKWFARHTSRLIGRATRSLYTVTGLVSPAAATLLEDTVERFIVEPILSSALWFDQWVSNIGNVTIELVHTGLVRTVTTKAAQVFAVILTLHSISRGALAAKAVQVLPWAMDAVVWATNPIIAVMVVGAVFVGALVIAGLSLLWSGEPEDDGDPDEAPIEEPVEPKQAVTEEPLDNVDQLVIPWDLADIAAQLRIEVTIDGSVIVHGIPDVLPRDVGEQVATIAAQAAVARLERILPHRQTLNRDDRRLLTKVARQAVRAQAQQQHAA